MFLLPPLPLGITKDSKLTKMEIINNNIVAMGKKRHKRQRYVTGDCLAVQEELKIKT